MVPQWWSWLLTTVGVAGLWLAGSRLALGWALGVAAQGLWLAYALTTRQYGFLVSAFAYGIVYLRNWRQWRRPAADAADAADASIPVPVPVPVPAPAPARVVDGGEGDTR